MYEVTINFGNENGEGVSSFLVDIDSDPAYDTKTHWTIIRSSMLKFMEEEPRADVHSIRVRQVPNRVIHP